MDFLYWVGMPLGLYVLAILGVWRISIRIRNNKYKKLTYGSIWGYSSYMHNPWLSYKDLCAVTGFESGWVQYYHLNNPKTLCSMLAKNFVGDRIQIAFNVFVLPTRLMPPKDDWATEDLDDAVGLTGTKNSATKMSEA